MEIYPFNPLNGVRNWCDAIVINSDLAASSFFQCYFVGTVFNFSRHTANQQNREKYKKDE